MFLVQLNGVPTKMFGDSGASVNVIDEPTLETLAPKPDMQPPDMNLYAYGSKEKLYRYLESHKQAAVFKFRVKAVVKVVIVDMVDLAMCITIYTSSV